MLKASPKLYYTLIWVLIFIGCAYLLLFPALILFLSGYLIYLMAQVSPLIWGPYDWLYAAGIVILITLAVWVTLAIFKASPDLPPGKPIDGKSFPTLVNRVNELCDTYNAPNIHHIKLTTRFRTELIRTPHSGFPFNYTNTLLIGLPVMACMSPLHLKLLMARQIGHLAQTRKNRSRRIIYLKNIWNSYAHYYKLSWQPDTLLLRLFFSWYAPMFSTCTLPLMRNETFIKDRCLFEITQAEQAAEAISIFSIKKSYLKNKFWPELNNSAYQNPKPAYLPYQTMNEIMIKDFNTDVAMHYFELEVNRETKPDSEIPNLMERLSAIGYEEFKFPALKKESAAQHFFGDQLPAINKQLDNIWYLKNKQAWNLHFKQGIKEKKRLKLLREQAAQALLSNAEANEYLLLLEKYIAPEKALPLYKEIYKTNLMNANVSYELGRLLLKADDPAGVDAMQIAMDLAERRTADCCHHIVEYMARTGNVKEAQHYRRLILEHQVQS